MNGIRYHDRRVKAFLKKIAPEFCSSEELEQYFFEQTGGEEGGGFYPDRPMPRIWSPDRRNFLMSACVKLGDRIGKEFNPKRFKPGDERFKTRKKPRKRKDSRSQQKGLIGKYARGEVQSRKERQTLKGPCVRCHTYIPSNGRRPVWFHGPCYDETKRDLLGVKEKNPKDSLKALKDKHLRSLLPQEPHKRGRPAKRETAQKHWDWASRLDAGEDVSDIARSLGIEISTVERGVVSLLPVLPSDPNLVREKFRDRLIRIRELAGRFESI